MALVHIDNFPLENTDDRLIHIEKLIEAKRRLLLNKQKKIRFISKQNRFLDEVRNDYNTYYKYIASQKQQQIKALEMLNNYIKDLTVSGNLSKYNIEDAKHEQKRIMKEMKSIQHSLDEIIEGTDDVSLTLKGKNDL
jgi:chromosome segregation ATPase